MKRACLVTAVALLSSVLFVVRSVGQEEQHDRLLEGCVRNLNGNLTLTDMAGRDYRLRGDTVQLADHVGQQAAVIGIEEPGSTPAPAGSEPIFTVKKVRLIGRLCAASK
jgi:hypothetical protein